MIQKVYIVYPPNFADYGSPDWTGDVVVFADIQLAMEYLTKNSGYCVATLPVTGE